MSEGEDGHHPGVPCRTCGMWENEHWFGWDKWSPDVYVPGDPPPAPPTPPAEVLAEVPEKENNGHAMLDVARGLLEKALEFYYDSSKTMGVATAYGGRTTLDRHWAGAASDFLASFDGKKGARR